MTLLNSLTGTGVCWASNGQAGGGYGPLVPSVVFFSLVFVLIYFLIKALSKKVRISMGVGWAGVLVGGLLGFLLRPSAPLIGQLPFTAVITRGISLNGADRILIPTAQTSFNFMVAGAILGAICAVIIGYFISQKKVESSQ